MFSAEALGDSLLPVSKVSFDGKLQYAKPGNNNRYIFTRNSFCESGYQQTYRIFYTPLPSFIFIDRLKTKTVRTWSFQYAIDDRIRYIDRLLPLQTYVLQLQTVIAIMVISQY